MTPNRHPGTCADCGGLVVAGKGRLVRREGAWLVYHLDGCPEQGNAEPFDLPPLALKPTEEQTDIVKLFATGDDLVVQALAGTGKTTTAVLMARWAAENGKIGQYVAFNKSIVDDAGSKLPPNCMASTMHSLAFRAVGHRYSRRLKSPRMKPMDLARFLRVDPYVINYGTERKTLSPGFLAGVVMRAIDNYCSSDDEAVAEKHFPYIDGIDVPSADLRRGWANNDQVRRTLLPHAQRAWADLTKEDGQLPFRHNHYLKIWERSAPAINVDFILFDEAQDASRVMRSIVAQQQGRCQIVAIGDSQQAINRWMGAVDALAAFEETGAKVAWLTHSFRFGPQVGDVANGLLGRLGCQAKVVAAGPASVVGPVAEPHVILTRSNAGAVKQMFHYMERGLTPYVIGGGDDVARFAKGALDLQEQGWTSHPELACFSTWAEVQDYVDTPSGEDLQLLVKLIDEYGAQKIIDSLGRMVRESEADVVISTAHKAKGRQWLTVQLSSDFQPPKDGASDVSEDELMLLYVACTRAQRELDVEQVPHVLKPPSTGRPLPGMPDQ